MTEIKENKTAEGKIKKEVTLHERLSFIQGALKVPKNNKNSFGGFNYRSCEDILEEVKPLLKDLTLILRDEIFTLGDRYYVKTTASLSNGKDTISASAYAREQEDKRGMDQAQVTGAASSYARKYALNGLFAIDDARDPDTEDNTAEAGKPAEKPNTEQEEQIPLPDDPDFGGSQRSLGLCPKCGASNRLSKMGKIYCGAMCWFKEQG